jgi:hypothetical protein
MPEFMLISTATIEFGHTTFSKRMPAKTIASADAFYLVSPPPLKGAKKGNAGAYGLAGAAVGGALGGLLGSLLDAAANKNSKQEKRRLKDIEAMKLSELSEEITDHPDWPIDERKGLVTVIHRPAVRSLLYSFSWFWFRKRFLLKTQLGEMTIFPPLFQGNKKAAFLEEVGWEL